MTSPIDYPDWHSSVGIHGVDAIIGTPVIGGAIGAGASITAYNDVINGASYNIAVDTFNANGATSLNPFTKVSMIWKDAVGGNVMDIQHWFILQTNVNPANTNCMVTGKGPTDAAALQVLLKNLDAVNAVTADCEVVQSGRPQPRHRFQSVSNNISGTYGFTPQPVSTPVSDCAGRLSGSSAAIVLANGAVATRINGLYAGRSQLSMKLATAGNLDVLVSTFDPEFATPQQPLFFVAASIGLNQVDLTLPCMPSIITFTNSSGAAVTFGYSLVMQDAAT